MDKGEITGLLMEYTGESDEEKAKLLVKLACRNVINRRYPFGCTEEQGKGAIRQYSNVVFNAALYAYNMQGAEGQSSHNENGVSRTYIDEDRLYMEIVPMCGAF